MYVQKNQRVYYHFTAWLRRILKAQICPLDVRLKESDPVFCELISAALIFASVL